MSNIRKYKISSGTIAADGTASAYSTPIRGKILAVGVDYPANTCTVDLDSDGEASAQKILDLSAANTDATYYPRTPVCTYAGAETVYWEGTNKVCEPFVVYGRVKLSVASGTAGQSVSVYLIVEEE
jgi:hypothetical protein